MKVGIDPGVNGAIAFVSDTVLRIMDMPTKDTKWKKPTKKLKQGEYTLEYAQRVDTPKLASYITKCPHEIEQITIEIVHSMPKQGVASSFNFGAAFSAAVAAVELAGYEPRMVFPQFWKGKCGLIGHKKDASRILCLQMYPQLKDILKRKKDVDRADALLIAIC